jgi:hypothetical protein
MRADVLGTNQIQSLASQLTIAYGPIAAKDRILTHVRPGIKQADVMSAMFQTYLRMVHNLTIISIKRSSRSNAPLSFLFR